MKTVIAALLTMLISLIIPTYSFSEELGAIRMSMVEGNVQVYDYDSEEWLPASINMPLANGDQISVQGDGRAELQVNGGIIVRLDHSTSFELVALTDTSAHFYLDYGHVYINNRKGGREIIQIDTPVATCTTADNSISLLDVDGGETELSLVKGHAFLESNQGKTRVTSGNSFKISQYGAEVFPIAAPDEWEHWNSQRDNEMQRVGESIRYLPEELHDYSNDFDRNGKWTFVKEYGYVWSPVTVSFDWVPFRMGQWIWVRGDYVWVSDERWGWAPYHFGRWTHIRGKGWCWVPPRTGSVAWGPGYVAWVQTPSSIGWIPLAPGEIYYGRKFYGHGTVVINNTLKERPRPSYRNVNINNSVTVISTESFHRRDRHKTIIRNDNPFNQKEYAAHVIAPPAVRKPRITPSIQTNVIKKPDIHHQREGRVSPVQPGLPPDSSIRDKEINSTDRKPPQQRGIAPTTVEPKTAAPEKKPSSAQPQPAVRQPQIQNDPRQTGNDQNQIKATRNSEKSMERPEKRGPRAFVGDSGQSAFKKERPQPLPLKRIEEPRARKTFERPKMDATSNNSVKPETNGQQRSSTKSRNEKP